MSDERVSWYIRQNNIGKLVKAALEVKVQPFTLETSRRITMYVDELGNTQVNRDIYCLFRNSLK
jgi:hypothetical protein